MLQQQSQSRGVSLNLKYLISLQALLHQLLLLNKQGQLFMQQVQVAHSYQEQQQQFLDLLHAVKSQTLLQELLQSQLTLQQQFMQPWQEQA
ncbi:MAG: hypothetical protein EBR82_86185 [Caulobacteraceae bacterium]|nr:hypothetical protein [Caulobacteraceae bacterium]